MLQGDRVSRWKIAILVRHFNVRHFYIRYFQVRYFQSVIFRFCIFICPAAEAVGHFHGKWKTKDKLTSSELKLPLENDSIHNVTLPIYDNLSLSTQCKIKKTFERCKNVH